MELNSSEIENRLKDIFEENYEFIKAEGGHSITDFMKEVAFNQVLYYFRKNTELIQKITDAEVRLTLPEQISPKNKLKYTIQGVIDIVQEGDEIWMYDLKTHNRESIENSKDLYKQQLNIYAYIWKSLRKNRLDTTAVISTALPDSLKRAVTSGNPKYIQREMESWDPVIPLGYSEDEIELMIEEFGKTVEDIENSRFSAPPAARLFEKDDTGRNIFAVRVCRNCDARFSCKSFRAYLRKTDRGKRGFREYLDDYGTDFTPEEYIEGNLGE